MAKIENNAGHKNLNQINNLPPKGKQIVGELIQKDTVEKASEKLFDKMVVGEPGLYKTFYKRNFTIIKKATKKDAMMRTWIKEANSTQKIQSKAHPMKKTETMSKTSVSKAKPKKK